MSCLLTRGGDDVISSRQSKSFTILTLNLVISSMTVLEVVVFLTVILFSFLYTFGGYHQIPQGIIISYWICHLLNRAPTIILVIIGHVGVYFRGGALLNNIVEPGFHTMMPVFTSGLC